MDQEGGDMVSTGIGGGFGACRGRYATALKRCNKTLKANENIELASDLDQGLLLAA